MIKYVVEVPNAIEWGIKKKLSTNIEYGEKVYDSYMEAKRELINILVAGREEYAIAVREARSATKDYFMLD
jgi:hypothetical protein